MSEEEIKRAIDLVESYFGYFMSEATWTNEMEKEVIEERDFVINIIKKLEKVRTWLEDKKSEEEK